MQSKPLTSHLVCIINFIHIIDCGYSVESFSDAHEKEISFLQLIKRLMLNFLDQLSIGRGEDIFVSFELDRPEKSCAHVFT